MENKEYLAQVIEQLSKPLPFKWKLQSYNKDKTKALCVAFIDARNAIQRLNEVAVYGWHREHFSIGTDTYCRLGLVMPDNTIQWRSDVGESENATERAKTSASDSLKRSATCFGLGLFLYDMDIVTLPVAKDGSYFNIVKPDGSKVWDLTKYINDEYKGKGSPVVNTTQQSVPKVTPAVPPKTEEPKSEIKPNTEFDKTDDSLERKAKAKELFAALDQASVLKYVIGTLKKKHTTVQAFIDNEPIELILETYTKLTEKK